MESDKKITREVEKMDMNKKIARIVGVLFIIGTVTGILSALIMPNILNAPDYLVKISANKNMVNLGVLLDLTMGISLSMMSVVLFSVFKKYNEPLALGAVIFRGIFELASYLGIAISWLLLLVLSQEYVSTGTPVVSNFQLMGTMLKGIVIQIDKIGLGVFFSMGAIIIYYVFYKTKLIPTWLSLWGLFGAILSITIAILSLFGLDFELLIIPLAVQEMVMAVWLIVKGFNPSAIAGMDAR